MSKAIEIRDRIITHLRNQCSAERHGQGRVVSLELRHIPLGSKSGNTVVSLEAPESPSENWYQDATQRVYVAAEADANAILGVQAYALYIFREKDPARPVERCSFRIAGQGDDTDGDETSSEPPTKAGLFAQLMRHNDAKDRTLSATMQTIVQSQNRMIESLAADNNKMAEQRLEMIETVERLISLQHERDLAKQQAEEKTKMMREGLDTIKLLGPAVINRISGGKIPSTDPQVLAVKAFLASLSQEQKDSFKRSLAPVLSDLKPEQSIALLELFNSVEAH